MGEMALCIVCRVYCMGGWWLLCAVCVVSGKSGHGEGCVWCDGTGANISRGW